MIWIIIIIIDHIIKCFQYAWFIFISVILVTAFLIVKKNRLNKNNVKERKKLSRIICCLIISIIVAIVTIRQWGPSFYKIIISFSICGKEKVVEQKLEKKYGKNFNYISQGKIVTEKSAGNALGQDINNDYSVIYTFKDDDGVVAIVKYKKNYQSDYYESKRSKYEIEKQIYEYAEIVKFNKKFYVYVESPSESINGSNLNDKARNDFICEERYKDMVLFVLTECSDENKDFITSALKTTFDCGNYFHVQEYVVTDEEYVKAVSFYDSINLQNGIAKVDYEEHFNFNENNKLQSKYYYIN